MSRAILASFIGLILLAPILLGAPFGHPVEQITVSVEALNLLVQNSKTAFERRYTTLWRLAPDERPKGARRVTLESRFPSTKYVTHLVSKLGYDGSAAFATMVRGHLPWMCPVTDRRKGRGANPGHDDERNDHPIATQLSKDSDDTPYSEEKLRLAIQESAYQKITDPRHPYIPAAPSCRKTVGGGHKKEKMSQELARRRWDDNTRAAVFEIVYQRQSTKRVAAARGLRVENLYRYATSLRADLHA